MNDHELNKRLRQEVEQLTPNRLDDLLAACSEPPAKKKDGRVITLSPKKRTNWRRWVAVAAMLVLLIGIGSFVGVNEFRCSVLTFDVNPSVSFLVNGFDRVREVHANNVDAAVLLYDDDLKGMKLTQAVETLTQELIEAGYLSDDANGVLVSVRDASSRRAEALQSVVLSAVEKAAGSSEIRPAVLYQKIDNDQTALRGISAGKTALVQAIAEKQPRLDAQELQALSVQDLFYVMDAASVDLKDAKLHGSVSESAYQDMMSVARMAASLCPANVRAEEIIPEIDCYGGELAYIAGVVADGVSYEYTVSATSGEVLDATATVTDPEQTPAPTPAPLPTPDPIVTPTPVNPVTPEPTPYVPDQPTPDPAPAPDTDDCKSTVDKIRDFVDFIDQIF